MKKSKIVQLMALTMLIKTSLYVKCVLSIKAGFVTFSLVGCLVPLIAASVTHYSMLLSGGVFLLIKLVGVNLSITNGIPTIAGVLVWQVRNRSLFWQIGALVAVPVLCISIFISHPVGYDAKLYTLYWLIPIAVFCVYRWFHSTIQIFLWAFASTFVTHAVGSVMWLYLMQTTPPYWIALIPIVALERCIFAVGMVGVYHMVLKLIEFSRFLLRKKHAIGCNW